MELKGRKTGSKTLHVIPLGLPESSKLQRLGIKRFMVEDYYVKGAFQTGELKEENLAGKRFITSKELLEKELFTENTLEEGEQEYLTSLLEKCELSKIAENIIRKINLSLQV